MHKYQQDFLSSILTSETSPDLTGQIRPVGTLTTEGVFNVYRSDYHARMMEALGKSFEATWLLMGDEEFFSIGKDFIKSHPSNVKNLSAYGDEFPSFIESLGIDEDVVKMAKFELNFWHLFHCSPRSSGNITPESLETLSFNLEDSLYLSHSQLKLNHLWSIRENPPSDLNIEDFMENEYLALYRTNEKVQVKKLSAIQFEVLTLLTVHKKIPAVFKALEHHESPPTAEEWATLFEILKFLI